MEIFKVLLVITIWLSLWSILDIIIKQLCRFVDTENKDYIKFIIYLVIIIVGLIISEKYQIKLR